ncbi:cilia- and flagella-associated protein 54 [Neophocaena asiaeorientalis asiaeorientalis]|uniref:Cilia- and flagella-associated protein 54 n=1 Tax=Neophocaena asiaeorientalis asiaeorientalis TaxID=1706337 RepID=A0A341C701_NEOAA|nr:cilia- and flagella-associated protein 54 [Neophocaena asiaeorientalis asiaeorientalis]
MAAQGTCSTSLSNVSPTSVSQPGPPPTPPPTSTAISKFPVESKASSLSPLPRSTCREDLLPLAVFYGPLDAKNPLLASCEKEIQELLGFMKRKTALATTEEQEREFHRRCATSLFNIWTKYAPRLPAAYYNEKLLKVGDRLCEMKEYKLALLQCYGRYLQQFSINFDENKADVNQFKSVFFPKGFEDKSAVHTFHALSGRNICNYQLVCDSDVNLQNKESVAQCLHILSSLRLIMQVALPQEQLCWIIFNGTIYIYTICRKLMIVGHSSKALEYLLWASVCMESSVPLLSIRYLTWRATLYTAVCQCYYDCQAGVHGEAFARRALAKIDELRQLELMSSSQSQEESRGYYREATIKMAVMIFKRGVFESRRKNKSFFRPNIRVNLREAQTLLWPRTVTEQLLDEMFDSTASRFLAVLEALSDSNRRTLQTGPVVTDEVEVRDVVSELFIAGKELLIMSNTSADGMLDFPKSSLLELIIRRKNVISVDAAVKFIKLAFTYEEWSLFESVAGQLIDFLQRQDDPEFKKAEKDLILLLAIEPLINVKRNKGLIFPLENYKGGQVYGKKIALHDTSVKTCGYSEDIFHLAATLYSCVCGSPQNAQPDKEIVVDMIMFLWQKCKVGIQRVNVSGNDYAKFTQKISTNKWVYLLWQINEIIHCYKMEDIDVVVVAEVALRLSEILESLGNPRRKFKKFLDIPLRKGTSESLGAPKGSVETLPILKKKPEEQLFLAYEVLEKAIGGINLNCMLTALPNGSSVVDHCYATHTHGVDADMCKPVTPNSFIMDLHLELIEAQHRMAVVLLDQLQVLQTPTVSKNISTKGAEKPKKPGSPDCFTELNVMNKIRKNKLSKAIYLMQKALLMFEKDAACTSLHNFLMEAYSLIEKTEAEQSVLYSYQKYVEIAKRKKSRVPPPPILLARTHCSVTLKPAPFISDVKVSWYCILGCKAEGSYGKVRLNNNHLPNSGEAIPADGKSIFEVKGLETNEKYIFAIAAYCSNGKLIGDAIGETTKPILVYPPLSAVTARMLLTQVAYQIGNYELSKNVFSPVWDYFVASPLQDDQSIISLSNIMTVTQRRLHSDILAESSSILLYLFLRNIFVTSDIKIKEENLFCDNIKGNEIFPSQQIARLIECERVLVALELSNYLNDSSYALQAVTQCYGLLAPIIYHSIVLVPVVRILIKCVVVLQGLPNIHSKKHIASFESVQHMIACCIFYITKILRSWKEYDLAVMIINYGKKMLDITSGCKSLFGVTDQEEMPEEGSSKKSSKTKKPQQILLPEKINEHLGLLETRLLKLTKQYVTTELSGAEDPIFLYPIVFNWSVKDAVKEVMKFKQRPRFLEFFTQVMQKCMNDENFQLTVEITNPVYAFLQRRNESLLGIKKLKHKDSTLCKKVIKPMKKFKAAVVEIGRSTEVKPRQRSKKKETLREFLNKNPFISEMAEQERNKRADVRKVAHRFLVDNLNPLILNYVKKKRFHQIFLEEMPWKAQMNLYLASAHFNLLLTKLGEHTKMKFGSSLVMVSFRSFDPNMFSLYNSGTVLPTGKLTLENYKVILDFLLTAKKRKAHLSSDAEEFSAFLNSKMSDENVSKTQTGYESDSQSGLSGKEKDHSANVGLLDHFMKIFLYCRRAMVLAHRGGYWTLLQNCCRALWNFTQELQILHKQAVDLYETFPISQDSFLCTFVLPFCLGAELLIDMLIELPNISSVKTVEEEGEFSVPSCYGNIKNDNGGSSLTFEHPLDDVNVVDLKWIHDFVLKSLELVYQVEKWETLVSLAIQFNTVSHERYTEQVTPLLVYAQRQLLLRISKCKGPDITQQPCVRYEAEYKQKITCRNFIGKQLKINPLTNKVTTIGHGADSLKNLIYSEYSKAKELLCVPVDVTDTLRCFRETLEKSKYQNRSIRHSRKLLSLFLAQTQGDKGGMNNLKFTTRKVEFCLGTEEMHMPTPPDLSQEHFQVFSSVEKSKLPSSQLGLVISSYYETINVLQASNERSLNVQALHELGSLLVFAQKKRAAFKCWSQALDDIFRKQDVLHTWKEYGSSLTNATDSCSPPGSKDYSEEFLSKVGIWGCLQGAVISAKIAQFIQTLDVEKRTNSCLLSGLLFQGLLRTTLLHPKAERCYAQYEITQLLPGIELFSDRYRADICSVVASLYYVIRELHFAKQNLIILPLLALYQYFVSGICQDLVRNLEARILKIEVLIDLGFFSEAFHEISQIFYGKNMPSSVPAGCKATGRMKLFQSFDSGKPLTSKENMQALDDLISKGLPLILVTVGQQHLLNKFAFVKAYFLVNVAATINCVPEHKMKPVCHGLTNEKNRPNLRNLKEVCLKDEGGLLCQLTQMKEDFARSTLKSILLTEAEDRLNFLVSEMEHPGHKNLSQCSAGELEIVVEVRLQLAAVALQRHRAAYSAAIAFSTLKLLQDSKLFKKKVVEDDTENSISPGDYATESTDDNEFLDPISLNSREYFNIHLWLRCRLALVTAFVAQIRGIGIVKENDITDCVSLINEVCVEAKSAGDRELQAEFLMQAVIIGLKEKHLKADIIKNLQDVIQLLEGREFISPRSHLTLVRSMLLLDDLTKAEKFKETPSSKAEKFYLLTQSHNILIEQMLTFGETIEFPISNTDYASPLLPLKNIYLPHVMLLAKTKMRIGHTVAKQVYYTSKKKDPSKWLPALHLFEIALKLAKISGTEEQEVEAEIFFQKGKIECQILVEEKSPTLQLESLFEAIQLSLRHDQNSGLIRDSYLEIALLFLHMRKPKSKLSASPSTLTKALPGRHSSIKEPTVNQSEMHSLFAWIAIRAAAQVSEAVLAINLLIGKTNGRTDKVSQRALPNIPEFATMDLLSSYTDYLLDNYQVAFQTACTFSHPSDEIYENVDTGGKSPIKVDITWILLLRYYIHLQRINNMSKLLASLKPGSGMSLPDDTLLTSLFNSGLILRQKEMHFFLKRFLQLYSSSCIDEFPKELFQVIENPSFPEKFLYDSSSKLGTTDSSLHSNLSLKLFASPSYGDVVSSVVATQALNKELCFQWYIPPLEKPPKETEPMVLLLYAYNMKPLNISDVTSTAYNSVYVGSFWIPLDRVISVHEKLSNLTQIAEIALPTTPKVTSNENVSQVEETEEESIGREMENMIIECCSEIVSLFLSDEEATPLSEVPFDISLSSMFSLERLFDLASGCIVSEGSLFNWMVSIVP